MRRIEATTAFRRDIKRLRRGQRRDLERVVHDLAAMIAADQALSARHRDHGLTGHLAGFRECHVRPDLILIYEKRDDALVLTRLGSHSELFG